MNALHITEHYISHCGHGHELTSVVRVAVFTIAVYTIVDIRIAFIGSTGVKVPLLKCCCWCTLYIRIAEKPPKAGYSASVE